MNRVKMPTPLLTDLILQAESGDADALRSVFDSTYEDLRTLARIRLHAGRGSGLLDTTALVHESFLRFANAGRLRIQDRQHFMRFASKVMHAVVVDHVRECVAQRRGGGAVHVTLTTQLGASVDGAAEILRVHDALEELAALDPRMSQVVEMRYFAGLTEPEIAEALEISERTVRRHWEKARLLLLEALQ
jgi:RNA polymerase sigma factor (TIGR02999 family)